MRILCVILCLLSVTAGAQDQFGFEESMDLEPSDYLMGAHRERKDPIFDQYRTVDLGVDIGVGEDCGRINFQNTLKGALKNVFDAKYFGDMGRDILASSPMLATCYFSPTWCAILKHSQVSAHFVSDLRLKQCSLVDKYTDSRVEDYYQERQKCVHKAIARNGGDMDAAMKDCSSGSVYDTDLSNWAGGGGKTSSNKLIESSAKWAGLKGDDADRAVSLAQGLVGETVVSRGGIKVEYGPRKVNVTPRSHLTALQTEMSDKLCNKVLRKVIEAQGNRGIESVVSNADMRSFESGSSDPLIDYQTLRSLAAMSYGQRDIACKKLSDALALTKFSYEMGQAVDVLSTAIQNPNLPDNRRRELEEKRRALKESVEMTLELGSQKTEPLAKVLSQVNERGRSNLSRRTIRTLEHDATVSGANNSRQALFDCADGVMCDGGR